MQDKDFDRFIQQALENQPEPEYNPADWDKLEDRLHNLHASQPSVADKVIKGGSSFGKLGFAATAILVTALNVVFFTQPELVKTASDKIATVQNAILSEPETNLPATNATIETDNTAVASPESPVTNPSTSNQVALAENAAETGTALDELPNVATEQPSPAVAVLKPANGVKATVKKQSTSRNTFKPATGFAVSPSAAGRPVNSNGAGLLGGKPTAAVISPCGIAKPALTTIVAGDTLKESKIAITSCQTLSANFLARETGNNNVVITSNISKILPGARLTADAATGAMVLQWKPKAGMARQQPYNFNISVTDSRCPDVATRTYQFALSVTPAFTATINGNTKLEAGESTNLEVNGAPAGATYKWLVGNQEVAVKETNHLEVMPLNTTTYRLQVTSKAGCVFTDSVKVEVGSRKAIAQSQIAIPNIFTPNGDGINDYFEIGKPQGEVVDLVIFDRWGKQIYSRKNYDNRWSGTNLESGTYYYIITLQGTKKTHKGWVEIMR